MNYHASVVLTGTRVTLMPLTLEHTRPLAVVGDDPSIWRWMPSAHHAPDTMVDFVTSALKESRTARAVPFAILDKANNQIVGSTRFHFIEPRHRRLEIGVTWIGKDFQRSYVNTEAKLLQLWYAFDVLGCRRVEWKADADNSKSRQAILRLGAREEGTFRKHMLYLDGRNRDSVYFSMIDDEWPAAKTCLELRLGYDVEPSCDIVQAD